MKAEVRAKKVVRQLKYDTHTARLSWEWEALELFLVLELRNAQVNTIKGCIKAIRANCSMCNGTGITRYEPPVYSARYGSTHLPAICEPCEYCGRPIDALEGLLKPDPPDVTPF